VKKFEGKDSVEAITYSIARGDWLEEKKNKEEELEEIIKQYHDSVRLNECLKQHNATEIVFICDEYYLLDEKLENLYIKHISGM
jgi:DNA-directed RNA polymerase alpha subunit